MDHEVFFRAAVERIRDEKRYRVFATSSASPAVSRGRASSRRRERPRDHHLVLQRLSRHGPAPEGDRRHAGHGRAAGRRRRRHAQYFGHQPAAGRARALARRPAPQGSGAGLHLGLRLQRGGDLDHRAADAGLRDLLRPAQPRLDDPGRAPVGHAEAHLPAQRRRASARAARRRPRKRPKLIVLRVGLFDGRRRRADHARSATSPRNSAR